MTKLDFRKKVPSGQEGPKNPKNSRKLSCLGLWQDYIYSHVLFLHGYESANGFLTSCKNHMSGKNLAWKLLDQSECRIL